jgi:hypothetical protein
LFESIEETLEEMAFGVDVEVASRRPVQIGLGRGHALDAPDGQGGGEAVGVVSFVGDQGLRLDFGKERFGLRENRAWTFFQPPNRSGKSRPAPERNFQIAKARRKLAMLKMHVWLSNPEPTASCATPSCCSATGGQPAKTREEWK